MVKNLLDFIDAIGARVGWYDNLLESREALIRRGFDVRDMERGVYFAIGR